ncbi:integrase, catalytic region, zinc finger, CCHC-type containing protein [Tanacetum coccineum]
MVEEVTSLKKDFKQKENKYLEDFLDMKDLKEKVEDRLFKQDQSLQTVHMLCKPKPHYDEQKKVVIGYKNPLYLTRAKQVQPALYNGHEIIKTHHVPTIVHDSKDTLEIAENTRKQMNEKMKDPESRCLELKAELSKLRDKVQKDDHTELVKRLSNLEITALLTKNENLKAQLRENMKCVTMDSVKPRVLAPGRYDIDVKPIPPRNKNNREVHLDYLKHLKESVETLREIVEEAKVERPLDSSLAFAYLYTKHSQELLEYVIEVNSCTDASRSKPWSNTKKNKISPAKSVNKKKVEEHPRTNKSNLKTMNHVDSKRTIVLWYLDLGCSKHMMGDRSQLINFVKKFIGIVRFGNDHFGAIMGYGDYVIGDSVISRVYYMEGLRHNLFSVGQFCDSDLEVAFRKHSCYARDTYSVELIKGSCGSNLYTISVEDMMNSSLICLLSKASKNKSWLWNHRLNHLNFGAINDLKRKDLVRGLPSDVFQKL